MRCLGNRPEIGGGGGPGIVHVCIVGCNGELSEVAVALGKDLDLLLGGRRVLHPWSDGSIALLNVLGTGGHLPGAAVQLLLLLVLEGVLAVVHHGTLLTGV